MDKYFLRKRENEFWLESRSENHCTVIAEEHPEDPFFYPKLSLKNCQAIELGYDLDELKRQASSNQTGARMFFSNTEFISGWEMGFQKALELMGDKKYTEKQMLNMFLKGGSLSVAIKSKIIEDKPMSDIFNKAIQSLQQTEWEVEIEMETALYSANMPKEGESRPPTIPKLDENGCLILKKK